MLFFLSILTLQWSLTLLLLQHWQLGEAPVTFTTSWGFWCSAARNQEELIAMQLTAPFREFSGIIYQTVQTLNLKFVVAVEKQELFSFLHNV